MQGCVQIDCCQRKLGPPNPLLLFCAIFLIFVSCYPSMSVPDSGLMNANMLVVGVALGSLVVYELDALRECIVLVSLAAW